MSGVQTEEERNLRRAVVALVQLAVLLLLVLSPALVVVAYRAAF